MVKTEVKEKQKRGIAQQSRSKKFLRGEFERGQFSKCPLSFIKNR